MSLKTIVYKEICSKIFEPLYQEGKWRVLVLDDVSTTIISNVMKMEDIYDRGITLVDNLHKKRVSVELEAIYLLTPTTKSISDMINDFEHNKRTYQFIHVFFTDECKEQQMLTIAQSFCANYILTLKEIYINFMVNESQIFTMPPQPFILDELQNNSINPFEDESNLVKFVYNETTTNYLFSKWAASLAALCFNLNENPVIQCQNSERANRFANCFREEMIKKSQLNQYLGQALYRDKSTILILDRSFDPLTPLLHDLHLQSLAHDIMDIKENGYEYVNKENQRNLHFYLTEEDAMWQQLRHLHIADASRIIPSKIRQLANIRNNLVGNGPTDNTKSTEGDNASQVSATNQLKYMAKKLPHIRQETVSISHIFHLSEACLHMYNAGLNSLCEAEQDLVMGTDSNGCVLKAKENVVAGVFNTKMTTDYEKIRLLITLILTDNGVSNDNISELIDRFNVDLRIYQMLSGLSKMGHFFTVKEIPRIIPNKCHYLVNHRRQIIDKTSYVVSRWVPFIKDLVESCINDRLHPCLTRHNKVPQRSNSTYLTARPGLTSDDVNLHLTAPNGDTNPMQSRERLSWAMTNTQTNIDPHHGPRLIVFVLGGLSFPEARMAYQITKACENMKSNYHQQKKQQQPQTVSSPMNLQNGGGRGWHWEVIMGSTSLITPKTYLEMLANNC